MDISILYAILLCDSQISEPYLLSNMCMYEKVGCMKLTQHPYTVESMDFVDSELRLILIS